MPKSVLIAEDDKLWADRLARVFEHAGYQVERAETWDKVANKVLSNTYDLFTCDLALGGSPESGVDMLTYLEGRYSGSTIIISNTISNKLLRKCHAFSFVVV